MREHEVPTHVQAEDRVLLGLTFPQIVAITAVCALSYGAYRYAPVGPSEVRMALAVLLGLAGIAAVVGKIGGRRLPLVAADLLKYRLGARVHAGPVSQLVRSGQPAPVQPVRSGPGPLRLMARRSKRALRRLRKKKNRQKERRNGRRPFRPHGWFGKRRRKSGANRHGHRAETLENRRWKPRKGFLSVAAIVVLAAAVATVPQPVLADDHWRDEIDFDLTEPVPGRRFFVEGLSVSGDRAAVTLRAATALDIRVRAFRRAGWRLASLLGIGPAGRGGEHRLLAPPARTEAVLHLLMGGRHRTGRGGYGQGSTDSLSPASRGGGTLRRARRLTGLDSRRNPRRHRVRMRCPRRGAGRASDGGRTRRGHRDDPDGRRGDDRNRNGLRRVGCVARERAVRPRRRDPLQPVRRRGRGHPRCDRRRASGGKPPHSGPAADAAHPPPGADRVSHRDGEPAEAGERPGPSARRSQ